MNSRSFTPVNFFYAEIGYLEVGKGRRQELEISRYCITLKIAKSRAHYSYDISLKRDTDTWVVIQYFVDLLRESVSLKACINEENKQQIILFHRIF